MQICWPNFNLKTQFFFVDVLNCLWCWCINWCYNSVHVSGCKKSSSLVSQALLKQVSNKFCKNSQRFPTISPGKTNLRVNHGLCGVLYGLFHVFVELSLQSIGRGHRENFRPNKTIMALTCNHNLVTHKVSSHYLNYESQYSPPTSSALKHECKYIIIWSKLKEDNYMVIYCIFLKNHYDGS